VKPIVKKHGLTNSWSSTRSSNLIHHGNSAFRHYTFNSSPKVNLVWYFDECSFISQLAWKKKAFWDSMTCKNYKNSEKISSLVGSFRLTTFQFIVFFLLRNTKMFGVDLFSSRSSSMIIEKFETYSRNKLYSSELFFVRSLLYRVITKCDAFFS